MGTIRARGRGVTWEASPGAGPLPCLLGDLPFTTGQGESREREGAAARSLGIDIDIPTGPEQSRCTRDGVQAAVLAAFEGGADGVVLSRKYSEMRLDNLAGAGDAIREVTGR